MRESVPVEAQVLEGEHVGMLMDARLRCVEGQTGGAHLAPLNFE